MDTSAPADESRAPLRVRDLASVVGAALAIATSAPLAKAAHGLSPFGVAAGRCGVAALAILLLDPKRTWGALARLAPRPRASLVGVGLILAIHFALFLAGLDATSLPAAMALVSLEPLGIVLAGWIAFGIRPSQREWAGIVLATAGAAVVAHGAGEGENRLWGDLLVLGSVVFYSAYVAAARGLRDTLPMLPYAAGVYGVAFLALSPLALSFALDRPAPPSSTWLCVLGIGIIPTLIGHTLVQRAARHVPPSIVALVSPGETIAAIAIGAVAQGAWPTAYEWVGTFLVLAGATLAVTRVKVA